LRNKKKWSPQGRTGHRGIERQGHDSTGPWVATGGEAMKKHRDIWRPWKHGEETWGTILVRQAPAMKSREEGQEGGLRVYRRKR
jgi:hypothetical protein